MALETLLIKVKKTITREFDSLHLTPPTKTLVAGKPTVGVLAFEIAGIMSKLAYLWQSLSDKSITLLRIELGRLEGVRKIVSNDENFLLGLACAEMVENLCVISKSVSRLSERCHDSRLRCFESELEAFANVGRDRHGWVLSSKEMEVKSKKMDQYIAITLTLYRQIDELCVLENILKKLKKENTTSSSKQQQRILDQQQKLLWQRQEVKYLKEKSLWSRNLDTVTALLARVVFTVLDRIKQIFAIGDNYPPCLLRSLSASALVYPSYENIDPGNFVSGPLIKSSKHQEHSELSRGFFETNSKMLRPPKSTLGFAALALHYANLVIVIEKMIKSPHLIGADARDDLYSMLPSSIRLSLKARLKGVDLGASDPNLAIEWRDALRRILGWLCPLAHNMIKWQSERSFEQRNSIPKMNVLLLQTMYFTNREKTEAAITELLVGLNYIWRFEREMNAKALFDFAKNSGGSFGLQQSN